MIETKEGGALAVVSDAVKITVLDNESTDHDNDKRQLPLVECPLTFSKEHSKTHWKTLGTLLPSPRLR